MAENKIIENAKRIEDGELDKVSGGALISDYSDSEYEDAGVEVVGSGIIWNSGYKLRSTKEEISWVEASYAVWFKKEHGRPVIDKAELKKFIAKKEESIPASQY